MKRYLLLLVLSGITAVPLSGCMMWMHGMDHGPTHQMPERAKTIEKEIPEKDARLNLDVPSLFTGEDSLVILTASRIRDGTPITGAKVAFLIEQLQQPGREHAEHHVTAGAEREAEEVAGKGMYQLGHRFGESGLYRITARVWVDKKEGAAPLTVSLTQVVSQQEGHKDNKAPDAMLVIGGIGMVLMMVIMLF